MTAQLCTFTLQDIVYGVDVLDVQEVISTQPMTCVPLAARELRGLINLRGQIVAAIDLRRRLGFPDRDADRPPMNVVVRVDGAAVSFLVDEIGDVVEADPSLAAEIPDTVPHGVREVLTEVYRFEHQLLHVLDVAKAAELRSDTGARSA